MDYWEMVRRGGPICLEQISAAGGWALARAQGWASQSKH